MAFLDRLRKKDEGVSLSDALRDLLSTYRDETKRFDWNSKVGDFPSGTQLLALPPSEQIDIVLVGSEAVTKAAPRSYRGSDEGLRALVERLMSRKLPFEARHIETLCDRFAACQAYPYGIPYARLAGIVERFAKENELTPAVETAVQKLAAHLGRYDDAETRKLSARFQRIYDGERADVVLLQPGDAWADVLIEKLNGELAPEQAGWAAILAQARAAKSGKPSGKWMKAMTPLVERVGVETYGRVIIELLEQVGRIGSRSEPVTRGWSTLEPTMVDDVQSDLLRGLIWGSSLARSHALYVALGEAAERAYKKLPGVGPRAPKIGNACVHVLGRVEDPDAIVQISRLKTRMKHASIQKQLEKALQAAADELGITSAELEEQATPDFGMQDVGIYRETVAGFDAEIRALGSTVELRWVKPDGKTQKTVPKIVKDEHGETLAELKRTVKEIQQMLPAVRSRLERLMIDPRHWELPVWRERFLDHPLVGTLARRLIWHFERGDGSSTQALWTPDEVVGLVGADGHVVDGLDETTRVSLWHPSGFDAEVVSAWRQRLQAQEISQPFKQAHREIYVLTGAEIETGTYSNRFAAHLIRQHQFSALAQARGWRYMLQGAWDSHNTPYLELPQWELAAQFWVDGVGDYGQDTSEAGIFLYVSTDQVRFHRTTAGQGDRPWGGVAGDDGSLPLTDVPALVFSEVMRDVDLFVGVCSVGNDPTWAERGEQDQYYGYWHNFSFGDLGATATTRKEVLEQLVPKLKIAERCSFSDKFLVVRGNLRTYKIHLGSSNILMEPNDQYLCIVPVRALRKPESVFLPFDGDGTMDVILSKAFMLADDETIKDPLIKSQIARG